MTTELAVPESVLDPRSGELIPASETARVADALANLRDFKRQVQEAIAQAQAVLIDYAERQGTKTVRFGATKVSVAGGSELAWDIEILNELIDAGLPEERFAELVTTEISYKVNANVARQIEASERYAEIIQRARRRVEKPSYVRVGA